MTSILLLYPTVLTMVSEDDVIDEGYVYIDNGKIVSVGKVSELPYDYRYADLVLNLRGRIVLPGFISYHNHLALHFIRFMGLGLTLDEWIDLVAWPYEKSLTPEESYHVAKLAIYSLLRNGVVGVADMHFNMDSVARAVQESGIIANLSVAIMDTQIKTYEETLKENMVLFKKWNGADDNRITVSLGPCGIRFLKPDQLQEISTIAKEQNFYIHMHISEVQEDVKYAKKKFGKRPVEVLRDMGFLGEKTLLAHAVWVSEREIDYVAKTLTNIAHCPISNTLLLSGIAPLINMLRKNVRVGFGIDINPEWDVLAEARLAMYLTNNLYGTPPRLQPFEILKMATGGLAKFPGIEKHGLIKPGYDANIVAINAKMPEGWPYRKAYYSAVLFSRANIETVIVRGEVLVDGGEVLTIGDRDIEKAKRVLSKKLEELPIFKQSK